MKVLLQKNIQAVCKAYISGSDGLDSHYRLLRYTYIFPAKKSPTGIQQYALNSSLPCLAHTSKKYHG